MEAGVSPSRILTVGIDNGLAGGLVAVDSGNLVIQRPLPVRDGDLNATEFIHRIQSLGYPDQVRICIEEPGKFAPGVYALCSTWKIFGQMAGALQSHEYTYKTVAPRSWQSKILGKIPKGQTKQFALDCYLRIFDRHPPTKSDKSKKPHDGIVDAALIAIYAERYLVRDEEAIHLAAGSRP
jgi:hypothetical protein